MKNQIWKWCGVLILSWCLCPLFAQSEIETKTLSLFDSPITWVKNYDGLIDGVHKASLCLAFDGFNCRGFLASSGSTQYLLEGSLQSSHLILLEKYEGIPSGYIEGNLVGDGLQLDWTSTDDKSVYQAVFQKRLSTIDNSKPSISIMNGTLDGQSVKMIIQDNTSQAFGSLIFGDGTPTQKVFRENIADGYTLQNVSAGYDINLVNTKEDQYVASFILPGANTASQLELILEDRINIRTKEHLSHVIKASVVLPAVSPVFDEQIDAMIYDWANDMDSHQNLKSKERFAYTSKIWFEIEGFSSSYISGILHYNNSWDNKAASKSFTYDRMQENMVKVAPFLKGSVKWENMIKQRMIAAKTMNNDSDQDQYINWISKATLIEPILCEGGLQFYSEANSVFGQAKTFVPWSSLTPLVISTSKLNKLRKVK